MAEAIKEYTSAINPVIAVNKDAEHGFSGAANAVNDPELKQLFAQLSAQRAGFASQLQAAVRSDGGDPADPSGVAGTLHRGWIALKGVLTGHSEHQILNETERGEDLSVSTYRDAMAKTLPADLRALLDTQFAELKQSHDNIKRLRDASASK